LHFIILAFLFVSIDFLKRIISMYYFNNLC